MADLSCDWFMPVTEELGVFVLEFEAVFVSFQVMSTSPDQTTLLLCL